MLIDRANWGTILEGFKRESLKHSLAQALNDKDTHLASALQDKLAKLAKPV
ncbi:hypothetical protein [Helicobacter suis]|uniref:hypothetical protein n=1 Tax=Helicobacter suis TaxID=104628 RepID=UPI0013D41A5A|nr:hypothetical protein [Helicobacter suis]